MTGGTDPSRFAPGGGDGGFGDDVSNPSRDDPVFSSTDREREKKRIYTGRVGEVAPIAPIATTGRGLPSYPPRPRDPAARARAALVRALRGAVYRARGDQRDDAARAAARLLAALDILHHRAGGKQLAHVATFEATLAERFEVETRAAWSLAWTAVERLHAWLEGKRRRPPPFPEKVQVAAPGRGRGPSRRRATGGEP